MAPTFRKIVYALYEDAPDFKTYSWMEFFNSKEFKKGSTNFLPVRLSPSLECIDPHISVGKIFDTNHSDYKTVDNYLEMRWPATIIEIAGLRVLARWIGSDDDSSNDFWINMASEDFFPFGSLLSADRKMIRSIYIPPLCIADKLRKEGQDVFLAKNFTSPDIGPRGIKDGLVVARENVINKVKFKENDRFELLDYQTSTRLRPAEVHEMCGRRICVSLSDDCKTTRSKDDRQTCSNFWIDCESFYIFPVGWAARNGYECVAKRDYERRTESIAEALEKGETPQYKDSDITPSQLKKPDLNISKRFEVGAKLELLDPLDQKLQQLKVATVLKVLNDDYVCIGIDGDDPEGESLPLHITSHLLFPAGYAQEHNVTLQFPETTTAKTWAAYLKEQNAKTVPKECFREDPPKSVRDLYKVGMKVEAADLCENESMCPATIVAILGRLLFIRFDGWEEEFNQFVDMYSHDVFPIGWCEAHGHVLNAPCKK